MDLQGEYWTRDELKAQGVSDHQIKRALAVGKLHRLAHGIYMRDEPGGMALLRALHHRYPELVFRGHTAMTVYGHRSTVMTPVAAVIPKGHRHPGTPLVKSQVSRSIDAREHQGLPVVSPAAAVAEDVHLNRVARLKCLEHSYAGFRGQERFEKDVAALHPSLQEGLVPLLGRCVVGASSQMERFFHLELRARGIDTIPNYRLGPYTWDIGIESATTVVDLDSLFFHGPENTRTFIIDRWKANHAEMMGWGHLQFTDACVQDPLAKTAAIQEIENIIAYRRHLEPVPVPGRVEAGVWEFHGHLR